LRASDVITPSRAIFQRIDMIDQHATDKEMIRAIAAMLLHTPPLFIHRRRCQRCLSFSLYMGTLMFYTLNY